MKQDHPIQKVRLCDLGTVEIDFQDDTVTVQAHVPVGPDGKLALYEEELTDEAMPPEIRSRARALGEAIASHLAKASTPNKPVPCTTCRGACCYSYDVVHLSQQDVDKFRSSGVDDLGWSFLEKPTISGFVASLNKKPRVISGAKEDGACYFLRSDGCSIYEHRPQICREYSAWTCGDTYQEDPKKVKGKVCLRVVP